MDQTTIDRLTFATKKERAIMHSLDSIEQSGYNKIWDKHIRFITTLRKHGYKVVKIPIRK